MNIAINTRFLIKNKMEGFGWYTYELSKRLVEMHPEHHFYFLFDRPYDTSFVFGKNVTPVVIGLPARHPILFVLWFEWSVRRALKKHKIDLFFSPDGYLSLLSKVPQIGTIHDINFEHFPKNIPRIASYYLRFFFPKFAKKAKCLIAVSDYTKQDVMNKYGIDEDKIAVIHNGASDQFVPLLANEIDEVRKRYTNGKPYFLFVGSLHPRKNLIRLIEAFEKYVALGHEWDLVIVGENMWKGKKFTLHNQELSGSRIHFTGSLKLDELTKVTGAAGALSYVPYFEGFGIPIVEAMKCNVPILSGNLTSLPEVAGDAALYCDPYDVESIKEGMIKLTKDDFFRNNLSKIAENRAKLFSWDKAAKELSAVLFAEKEVKT
ncbi:MAG: glycosyltransferase involved in cell wall biosynthesis [Lentimonas sp.]|jgi:glycosyltransferase involved in cell wall biosynthesis